ncbi:poly(A)+ mRNA export from nucleus [Desmophyllum pertusum]|uniref:Poly(A)+ mRNA export from nucleus n=1 Tax=Desmophyllum pertusum TaxID=174260 RepID=A0A9W9Z1R1_9CNID|nr:poly(A)+ mRNA export from nucleus [Desmophyllum pertusum]
MGFTLYCEYVRLQLPTVVLASSYGATLSLDGTLGAASETVVSTEKIERLQANPVESSALASTPQQQEMVRRFSEQSTMNVEWSYKCLSENEWNYEKAALAFTSLKDSGSVPPEAFVK